MLVTKEGRGEKLLHPHCKFFTPGGLPHVFRGGSLLLGTEVCECQMPPRCGAPPGT